MPGTHAQNVIGVAEELQDLPPASTVALALALALALVDVPPAAVLLLLPDELHAASSETAAAPATAMVILRVLVDIVTKLLCSVLPHLRAVPSSVQARGTTARKLPGPALRRRCFQGQMV
jgi:hypothetical protein